MSDSVQLPPPELRYQRVARVELESVMNRTNRNRLRDHNRKLHQNERRKIVTALLRLLDEEQDANSSNFEEDTPVSLKRRAPFKLLH